MQEGDREIILSSGLHHFLCSFFPPSLLWATHSRYFCSEHISLYKLLYCVFIMWEKSSPRLQISHKSVLTSGTHQEREKGRINTTRALWMFPLVFLLTVTKCLTFRQQGGKEFELERKSSNDVSWHVLLPNSCLWHNCDWSELKWRAWQPPCHWPKVH